MPNSVHLIKKRPRRKSDSAFSNFTGVISPGLEVGNGQSRRRIIIQQIPALDSTLTADRRCFSQFDRITQTRMPRGFKSATHDGFRPDRTGLRKTPSSWLPANEIRKGHPGFMVSRTGRYGKAPFLIGVYDLVCSKD